MTILKYGNTNTFFIEGNDGGLLVDTDYAGTLPAFYKALKQNRIKVNNIKYVLATHYHPDHMGLISELMKQGAMLLLIDVQRDYVHFSDSIFARDRLPYTPIDESLGTVISSYNQVVFVENPRFFTWYISVRRASVMDIS